MFLAVSISQSCSYNFHVIELYLAKQDVNSNNIKILHRENSWYIDSSSLSTKQWLVAQIFENLTVWESHHQSFWLIKQWIIKIHGQTVTIVIMNVRVVWWQSNKLLLVIIFPFPSFFEGGKKTFKLFQDFQLLFFLTPGVILMTKEKRGLRKTICFYNKGICW